MHRPPQRTDERPDAGKRSDHRHGVGKPENPVVLPRYNRLQQLGFQQPEGASRRQDAQTPTASPVGREGADRDQRDCPEPDQRRPTLMEEQEMVHVRLPCHAYESGGAAAVEDFIGNGTAGQHDEQRARDERPGQREPLTSSQPDQANDAHQRQRRAAEDRHRGVAQGQDPGCRGQQQRVPCPREGGGDEDDAADGQWPLQHFHPQERWPRGRLRPEDGEVLEVSGAISEEHAAIEIPEYPSIKQPHGDADPKRQGKRRACVVGEAGDGEDECADEEGREGVESRPRKNPGHVDDAGREQVSAVVIPDPRVDSVGRHGRKLPASQAEDQRVVPFAIEWVLVRSSRVGESKYADGHRRHGQQRGPGPFGRKTQRAAAPSGDDPQR